MNRNRVNGIRREEPRRNSKGERIVRASVAGTLGLMLSHSAVLSAMRQQRQFGSLLTEIAVLPARGVAPTERYTVQLEAMLKQKGYDVTVINEGGNGRTSSDAIANLNAAVSS